MDQPRRRLRLRQKKVRAEEECYENDTCGITPYEIMYMGKFFMTPDTIVLLTRVST